MTAALYASGVPPVRPTRFEGDFNAPDELTSSLLRRLLADWTAWAGPGDLPPREAFDILRVDYIAGRLDLLDIVEAPSRYRYRVHGSVGVMVSGRDLTGHAIEAHGNPQHARLLQTLLEETETGRRGRALVGRLQDGQSRSYDWQVLALPLTGADGKIDSLLCAHDIFARPPGGLREPALQLAGIEAAR